MIFSSRSPLQASALNRLAITLSISLVLWLGVGWALGWG